MANILYKRENGVSYVTFNRPNNFNAVDVDTLKEMLTVIKKIEKNDDMIVVINGEGRAFSAGGDITMMGQKGQEEFYDELMDVISEITITLYSLPKIVVAAVHGSAAGLGLSFALNSDYIIAQKDARFGMLFAGIGLVPDGGGHFFLQERMGTHQAKQFIWGLKQVKGEEAVTMGLADILVDDIKDGTAQLVEKLKVSPLKAILASKSIYHEQRKADLKDILAAEKANQLKMMHTEDHKEGITAFMEKRKAMFQGK